MSVLLGYSGPMGHNRDILVPQILGTNSQPLDDSGLQIDFDYTFAFMESANVHS
jgi:hypothetical protein